MSKAILAILAIAISACSQNNLSGEINTTNQTVISQTPKKIIEFQSKNASVAEIAECHKQGGVVQQVGMLGFDKCIMTYPDAGKTCTKGDDCHSGTCELTFENSQNIIAPMTGVCKADNNPFGCRSFIESGQVQTICVD